MPKPIQHSGRSQVVKVRAESMAAAAARAGGRGHGMLSVVGLPDAELDGICAEARGKLPAGTVCQVANYLFPTVGRPERAQPARGLHDSCSEDRGARQAEQSRKMDKHRELLLHIRTGGGCSSCESPARTAVPSAATTPSSTWSRRSHGIRI